MCRRGVFTGRTLYFSATSNLVCNSKLAADRICVRHVAIESRLEEIMIKQITIGIAALALGVAFASPPASAQQAHYGRALNDGGMVDDGPSTSAKPVYNSAATAAPPAAAHYGRAANDGGMVDTPPAAALKANSQVKTVQSPPHNGRALNDGGF
jgi:hypothetical protein